MRRVFALLCFMVLPAAAAEDAALAVVEQCRARLDARADVGLERIERKCPDLVPALQKAPWRELLPPGIRDRRDEVTAESLRELAELVRRASRDQALRDAPDTRELAPVLAELGEQGQQGATRWERFKRWLRDKLERRGPDEEDEESWVERLGRHFETSEGVARAITYTGYTLMGVLVLMIIWSELRAAGLWGEARARRQQGSVGAWRRRLQLADVASAPLADRPGLLLRLLGEALARAHRLPAPDGLTAQTIARRAELDDDSDREGLAQVAGTADAVRYGARQPDDEQLQRATERASRLLSRIVRKPGNA